MGSFHFLEVGLPLKQKVLNFNKVRFIYIFILSLVLLLSYFRNHCLIQKYVDLLLCFLLNVLNFYLLYLGRLSIQSYILWWEIGVKLDSFVCRYQVVPPPLLKDCFLLDCLDILVKTKWSISKWKYCLQWRRKPLPFIPLPSEKRGTRW